MTSRGRKSATGTFHVRCRIENHVDRSKGTVVPKLLVDTGSDYTWIPTNSLERIGVEREKKDLAFVMANGQIVTRRVGFAIVRLDRYFTIDEVVFAESGDLPLLGARSLEGLNLTVDPKRKRLVASGPLLAAAEGNPQGS
jgi:predicted aspartyl protease